MCLHFLNLQASAECTCLNFQHFLGCIFRPALDSVVLLTTKNGFCISAKKTFELHFRLQQTYFFSNVRQNKKGFWLKLKKDNIRRIRFIFCLFWLFVGGHRYDTGRREMMGWSPWEMFRSHLGLSWKLFYLKFATFPFLRHQEHSFHFGIPLLWRKVVWEVVFWCLGFWGVACAGSPRHTTQCRSGNPHWLQFSQGTWLGVANPFFLRPFLPHFSLSDYFIMAGFSCSSSSSCFGVALFDPEPDHRPIILDSSYLTGRMVYHHDHLVHIG